MGFIRKMPNLKTIRFGCFLRMFVKQDEIDFVLDLVRGTPSLTAMFLEVPYLDYFLGCNCFKPRGLALFSSIELPLEKLWPRMLCNASRLFHPRFDSEMVESHEAIYKLLVDAGTESFLQVLLARSNSASYRNNNSNGDGK